MDIRVLIVVPDPPKRELFRKALSNRRDIHTVGQGPDLHQAFLSTSRASSANVIALDLADPDATKVAFWTTLHVTYPAARLIEMCDRPVNDSALQLAIQAGVYCFALWSDDKNRLSEAVITVYQGRRFYSSPWLLVEAQKTIRNLELGTATPISPFHGQAIHKSSQLSSLETAALAYLVNNEGRIISTHELFHAVWKQESDNSDISNAVSCCIKRLRRKLYKDPSNAYEIRTLYKQGYALLNRRTPSQ